MKVLNQSALRVAIKLRIKTTVKIIKQFHTKTIKAINRSERALSLLTYQLVCHIRISRLDYLIEESQRQSDLQIGIFGAMRLFTKVVELNPNPHAGRLKTSGGFKRWTHHLSKKVAGSTFAIHLILLVFLHGWTAQSPLTSRKNAWLHKTWTRHETVFCVCRISNQLQRYIGEKRFARSFWNCEKFEPFVYDMKLSNKSIEFN